MKQTRTKVPPVSKFLIGKRIESLDELMEQEYIISLGHWRNRHKPVKVYHEGFFQNWHLHFAKQFIRDEFVYAASKAVEIPVHIIKSNPKM